MQLWSFLPIPSLTDVQRQHVRRICSKYFRLKPLWCARHECKQNLKSSPHNSAEYSRFSGDTLDRCIDRVLQLDRITSNVRVTVCARAIEWHAQRRSVFDGASGANNGGILGNRFFEGLERRQQVRSHADDQESKIAQFAGQCWRSGQHTEKLHDDTKATAAVTAPGCERARERRGRIGGRLAVGIASN